MSSSGSDLFKLVGRILIENADAISAIDDTIDKAQGLSNTLSGVSEGAESTGRSMGKSGALGTATVWMGNMFTKITEKGIALGKFIGKTGFGFNANMEAYQNQFASLLGDADKAAQLVSDLQLLAKISPLGMEGLANNAVTLLTTGTELADIIPTLEMLGNLALGDANKMASVVRAYSQIMTKDNLMAQEMWQLSDAGVPIIEIMTKFGGERYADGNWLMEKLSDKDYVIPAEHFLKAFQGAVAEGGKWHNYMYNMMDTWLGQTDRMGEEGKETLGAFMKPFFDMAKSNVLPSLTESLGKFGTWVSENQATLEKMADAIGELVTTGFDKIIETFTWFIENGEAVKTAMVVIAGALTIGAIAAHPYATAIMAVVAGLAALTAHENKVKGGEILAKYSDEDLANLQAYVKARRELQEAEKAAFSPDGGQEEAERLFAAQDAAEAAEAAVNRTKGLMSDYMSYLKMNGVGQGEDIWIDIPLKAAEGSEAEMQTEIDGYDMTGVVRMLADTSYLQAAVNATGLSAYVNLIPSATGAAAQVDGSHAGGLEFVPRDNYIARLHKGEAVLTSSEAALWRSGTMGGDVGRLEAAINNLGVMLKQISANTAGGHQVVLDSGVLVGQIAPAMDARLGTITNRKGRGN